MSKECASVEALLSEYLDARLLPTDREVVQNHLAQCLVCRTRLAELRRVQQAVRDLPKRTPPEAFYQRVLTKARKKERSQDQPSSIPWVFSLKWVATACVLAVVVLSVREKQKSAVFRQSIVQRNYTRLDEGVRPSNVGTSSGTGKRGILANSGVVSLADKHKDASSMGAGLALSRKGRRENSILDRTGYSTPSAVPSVQSESARSPFPVPSQTPASPKAAAAKVSALERQASSVPSEAGKLDWTQEESIVQQCLMVQEWNPTLGTCAEVPGYFPFVDLWTLSIPKGSKKGYWRITDAAEWKTFLKDQKPPDMKDIDFSKTMAIVSCNEPGPLRAFEKEGEIYLYAGGILYAGTQTRPQDDRCSVLVLPSSRKAVAIRVFDGSERPRLTKSLPPLP